MNVRMSYNDLKAFDRQENAVALADGSGYVGTLSVYHEIHCVVSSSSRHSVAIGLSVRKRWMHKYMYQEIYWPDLDDAQREENRLHSGKRISTLFLIYGAADYVQNLFVTLTDL